MLFDEFKSLLAEVKLMKCETQTLEIKKAKEGSPARLYDTLSSFSNQEEGGVILFGIDEQNEFSETGVYDAHDLQKKICEQCKEMEPPVRPLLNAFEIDGKVFVTAEIPGLDVTRRPCFYKGKGRLKGAYIRIGDSDEPMTEYEIYSYEAFRERHQDDIRIVDRADAAAMDLDAIQNYFYMIKKERTNFSKLTEQEVSELANLTIKGKYTVSAVLMFGKYPQTFYPRLCITAVRIPGTELGALGDEGERFLDNRRMDGSIQEMFEGAMQFVQANMRTKTIINPQTGHREDRVEYPQAAVREAILNALAHRDYSVHSEGMPIQILMFSNRMEIRNPGGLYGRMQINQLGKAQPDTRNPVLVSMMEAMNLTENRYSGIPTIRREMKTAGLPEPEFFDERGSFVVRFYNRSESSSKYEAMDAKLTEDELKLIEFCHIARSKKEIADYLGISTVWYVISKYVYPLVDKGYLQMTMPEKPGSPKQKYIAARRVTKSR